MNRQVFCVVDPNLKDLKGHYFEYDYSLMKAAQKRGYEFLALGHQQAESVITGAMPVRKVFPQDVWHRSERTELIPRIGRQLTTLMSNVSFYLRLRSALNKRVVTSEWVVFSHMITPNQVLAWAWWVHYARQHDVPRLVLLFRYSADRFATSRAAFRAFRILEASRIDSRIRICSDSERLARDYAGVTRLPIQVVPIPHTSHPALHEDPFPRSNSSAMRRLVSLGNARDEKGFLEILRAIQLLHRRRKLDRFEFVLQANDTTPEILLAIRELESLQLANVSFIQVALSSDDYYRTLAGADVVLAPYWRSVYASRTSGIFVEAAAAGKPVIVTEDTWMGDRLKGSGAGLACRDRDPANLAERMLQIAADYDKYAERAVESRGQWIEEHNPDALMEALLTPSGARQGPTKIAVLYPWGDVLVPQSGASRRVSLLVKFLKSHFPHIWVVAPGSWPEARVKNVRYSSYRSSWLVRQVKRAAFWGFRLGLRLMTLGESRGEEFMFLAHQEYRFEPSLRRRIRQVSRWADVVLLEYTFWAKPVIRACRREKIRVILTDYDVVNDQIGRSLLLKELVKKAEISALKSADHAVCVSVGDHQTFKIEGVDTVIVPHPIDLDTCQMGGSREQALRRVEKACRLQFPEDNVCLFIGSYFSANLDAVQKLRDVARRLWSATMTVNVVVAGACCSTMHEENFIGLGPVEEAALEDLYLLADLVVMPLPYGTGASVKTIEAMAHGKPVIGTRVAFRGLGVIPGIHGVICDDVEEYPTIITDLLQNRGRRVELGRNARRFAEAYDYRSVYRRYVDLIEEDSGEALAPAAGRFDE